MKKIFRTVAALAVVMFAGCTNDMTNDVVAPVGGKTTIEVGLGESRTYLGELVDGARKVFWSSDDKIAVNGQVSGETPVISEDKTSATFEFETELQYPYSILYPAEMYKDANTITLPAVQESATNSFACDAAPMAVYCATEGAIQLHHLAGVIRLQVTLPAESTHGAHILNKVEIKGNAGEQMSGDFAIDYLNVLLAPTSTADADKVVTAKAGKTLVAGENDDIFVVVPAGRYAEGITVRLIDDAGHYMDISSKDITVEKGEIKAMPVVEFVPTGTLVGVEIKSAADLVAFAKAYNAGDYFKVEPFVVHITEDIVFDDATNAEWEPIGNKFGADNKLGLAAGATNYWHGYLEGNGHSIKNWKSVRPLFEYTGGGSMIKDLTVDASCTLTANFADGVEYYGPFVGYHRGNLINCHNYANITVTGTWDSPIYVGGVVSRTVIGSVEECTNHGNITVAADFAATERTFCCAGVVGYISNSDGHVANCTNYGKIVAEDGAKISESDTEDWDSYVYMGGIVGKAEGNIADCVNDAAATITTQMEAVCHQIGGIVGCSENAAATVRRCTNHANINFNTLPTRTSDADGRYGYIGGIAGQTVNDITDCANYGSIYSTASLKMLYIGGIVGLVSKVSDVEHVEFQNNINGKDVVIQATGAARVLYIGGLIGENNCSTTIVDLTNDTGSILGTIKGGNVESSASYGTASFGGYVGATIQPMTIKGTTEGANIELDYTVAKNALRHCHGGVIGSSTVAGLVVENAESNNYIKVTTASSAELKYVEIGMGGILGYALKGGVTVTNATSNCPITWNRGNKKSNGYPCYTGGIVGYIVEGDATITGCHNTADIKNCFYNNNGYAAGSKPCSTGGILGGFGWLTEDGALTITNCSNTGKLYAMRGCAGGIAGSVRNATISGCTFTEGEIYNAGTDANLQGVVGGISSGVRNSTITDCTVKANMIAGINGSVLYRAGGIVGVMEGTSSIDNCAYFGTISHYNPDAAKVEYYGGIAGMAANATIKNSKFGGTIWGTAITESNYEAHIANLVTNGGTQYNATVENCSYWDGN